MGTSIYYFSGTGNSLHIAQLLAKELTDSNLISIAKTANQDSIETDETVGIVCPIYMYNLPLIVVDFIKKIKSPKYFFIVLAGGGEPGYCVSEVKKLCLSQNIELSALFNITMPSNYTPYGATPEDKQKEYFTNAEKEVKEIAGIIASRKKYIIKRNTSLFKTYIHPGLLYKLGYKYINVMAKSFTTDENCNGCSICEKVCPVKNITMADKKPVWDQHCQQCYACLQWCPNEAVQYGNKTAGIKRYHNPFIKAVDIINSAK